MNKRQTHDGGERRRNVAINSLEKLEIRYGKNEPPPGKAILKAILFEKCREKSNVEF